MKKVFLGGTCFGEDYRQSLIPKLEIDYFNPVVEEWTEADYQRELRERADCDYCLYVITNNMQGVYSIAEVIDDSNKRPEKTIFCFVELDGEFDAKMQKSLKSVGRMVADNGATWVEDFENLGQFLV